jgi:branched-chain amino acid transport system ATP-binding protein
MVVGNASDPRPILTARNLGVDFRGLHALEGYEVGLGPAEILGVIGPNGAGKTTLFNLITGYLEPTSGTVRLNDVDITGKRTDIIAKLGIVRTFQTMRLFGGMSVLDNVKTARQIHVRTTLSQTLLGSRTFRASEAAIEQEVMELLRFFRLASHASLPATSMAYGDQRRLEVVRALATQPKVVLLDEPAAGMNPSETDELLDLILEIREKYRCAIILVEHDMRLVMRLCDRIQVLNYGRLICEGTPDEVRRNPMVVEAYLGKTDNHA